MTDTSPSSRASAWLILVFAVTALPARSHADVPPLLPIQGYLTDPGGQALSGARRVTFRLYAAATGGTPFHEETIDVVSSDGYFSAYLGDSDDHPLDLPALRDAEKVFLGIEIEDDGEAVPRLQIGSTAFSAQAAFCGEASRLEGKAAGDFAPSGHTHAWDEISALPATYPPSPHTHGSDEIMCYDDLRAEGYLDADDPNDLLTQGQADGRFAAKSHPHDAAAINAGNLDPARYKAIDDLAAEGYLNNDNGADLLQRAQADARYAPLAHAHGSAEINAYADMNADGYFDNNAGGDILTREQGDLRWSAFKNFPYSSLPLTNSWAPMATLTFTAPAAGHALITSTGYCNTSAASNVRVQIDTTANAVGGYVLNSLSILESDSQGSYAVSRALPVAAGPNTFYVLGQRFAGTSASCVGNATVQYSATLLP